VDGTEKLVAVVPCLNEAQTIAALVQAVRRHIPSILVLDDGSIDNTARLAADAGAEVVSHSRNFGKGAAVKTGLSVALRRGFNRALLLDGDGQHCPGTFRCLS
jgi:glycosyltransferase involved in cell wall biosynthesis